MHGNMIATLSSILGCAVLAAAGPALLPRTVTALDEAGTAEAQQRDDTATRAFSDVQIKVLPPGQIQTYLHEAYCALNRHPMAGVSSLTSYRATSART